jgi:hypothetical protein
MRLTYLLPSLYRLFLGIALSIVVLNLGSGCGAMFNSTTKVVPIRVAPQGARIYVDGLYVAQSPTSVVLNNATSHSIDLEADGYQRQSTHVESRPAAGFIVLDCVLLVFLIVPGIIALVVDGSTGDWKTADVDAISASLTPALGAPYGGSSWYAAPAVASPWGPAVTAPPPPPVPRPAPTGCQYDAQCKENRICQEGRCVDPSPAH